MSKDEKIENMGSALLSIYDSLKLADNGYLDKSESLSEMMFRKMGAYNIDLNEELGFTHLKPIKKKEKTIADIHKLISEHVGNVDTHTKNDITKLIQTLLK